jgi:hypothetical protein
MKSTMLTDLATELLLMPDKIANIQTELLLLNEKQQVLFMKVEIEELKLKMEIADATDDTGKKLYSNEDSRRAALSTKKANDPMIQDLNREERHLQTEIQMKKIELEKAANTQRNVRSILSFFSSGIVDSPEFE